MNRSFSVVATIVVTLMAIGCGAAPPSPEASAASVSAVLDSMHAEHAAAYLREDLEAVMKIYTDDAVIRPNHAGPVEGRQAIREVLSAWFAVMDFQKLTYITDDVFVHGDTAYTIGRTEATVVIGESAPVTDRGSYMVMLVRNSEGNWRSHRGVFNSSLPLAPQ